MTIIYDHISLQYNVLDMFKEVFLSNKLDFFCLASPWITNLSFNEISLQKNLEIKRLFPQDLSLLKLLSLTKKHLADNSLVPVILTHSFNTKVSLEKEYVLTTIADANDEDDLIKAFRTLNHSFSEYSTFNRIWMYMNKKTEKIITLGERNLKKCVNILTQIGGFKQQIEQNINKLQFLGKITDLNFDIMLNSNFHAKIFVTTFGALAGSSNWTHNGFNLNDEINVYFANIKEFESQYLGLKNRIVNLKKDSVKIESIDIENILNIHESLDSLYTKMIDRLTQDR